MQMLHGSGQSRTVLGPDHRRQHAGGPRVSPKLAEEAREKTRPKGQDLGEKYRFWHVRGETSPFITSFCHSFGRPLASAPSRREERWALAGVA